MLTSSRIQLLPMQIVPRLGMIALSFLLVTRSAVSPRSVQAGDLVFDDIPASKPNKDLSDSEFDVDGSDEPAPRRKRARPTATEEFEDSSTSDQVSPHVIGNGFGTMGRASHLAGKTFGRNDSITPLEFMPYMLTDQHFIFADVRGFVTNRSQGGGNLGIGYRRLFDDRNAWAGASLWYDADQSTSRMFQQVGLSFECLIQQFEFRSNIYLPVTSSQIYSNTTNNAAFVGNQLLYTRSIDSGTALRGIDAEIGYGRPVLDRHIVRGFVGGYHFEGGSSGGVNGFKARIEGVANHTITAQALYTHDHLYGDNLMVGLSMQFPFASNHPSTGWTRNTPSPFRFVERNYNVIVDQSQTNDANQVATDPTTGQAYVIDQVYAPASGPVPAIQDGTTVNPFSSVAAAQAAGGNVIFVQSGSVLNQPITLSSGQHLFGQGNFSEKLATTGGGYVQLPNLLQAGQTTPIIQNVTGTAVTLASGTEVAGFNIVGSTGNGIAGNGVSGISLHDLVFASVGSDAINLTNASGNVTIQDTQIASSFGNGIVFNGGNPNIAFYGSGNTISTQGNGFVLENLTGGTIAVSNLSLTNVGETGLVIDNVATEAFFSSLSVTQSGMSGPAGSAVAISGTTGADQTYRFTGTTTITSPSGAGLVVDGTDAKVSVTNLVATSASSLPAISLTNTTSTISLGNVTVNTHNAMGLSANNVSNLQVSNGTFTTVNAPALDVESSAINATLRSVSVDGGPYGIKLESSTGTFTIQGSGGYASGGTIQNTTTAGVLINSFTNTSLNWIDFVNNATGIQSTGSTQLALTDLRINGSAGYAIDSLNDSNMNLFSSILAGNGSVGGGTVRMQASAVGTFNWNVENNTITDPNGTAIQLQTQPGGEGATLTSLVTGNTITGYHDGSSAIGVNWTGTATPTINSNTINAYGSNMTAVMLQDASTTGLLTGTMNSNLIYFQTAAASSGTGIWVIDGQSGQTSTITSLVNISTNTIQFQGTGGTGLRFGLYDKSTDTITTNIITDQAGGATGMLFDSVAANTTTTITGNTITLLAGDSLMHRGIIFTQVTPTMNLYTPSSQSAGTANAIYNATSTQNLFSMPAGTAVGGIIINGSYYVTP
ncbi:inverse autotransporter beta domain-containing protein [Schlesneria paludicola]|uniref:inverse autotransporter beta domain-containing protein n=1 Tax=Schlesneria paludicola TaxID=360056 RepID=UPI00029A1A29|nr:inverse autotransporter beta domain-containing protein [Schlesneria paludicola]